MAKSPAMVLENLMKRAFEEAEEHRQAAGFKARHLLEKREKAKDGQLRNWWGPKSYKITLHLRPWHYIKLIDNMNRAGYPSVHKFVESMCTDAELVGVLEAAGVKRVKKAIAEVVPLKKKRAPAPALKALPPVPAPLAEPHYGLPTPSAKRRALHA